MTDNNPAKIYSVDISELIPDSENCNEGSERGTAMLQESLQNLGAGRSVLLDRDNKIICGNQTYAMSGQVGLNNNVLVVETTGDTLVAVKRIDLSLTDPNDTKARALAIADNRVSEENYKLNIPQLLAHSERVDLSPYYSEKEMAYYAALAQEALSKGAETGGMGSDSRDNESGQSDASVGQTRMKPGEVWRVGEQYLICGDCREVEVWEKLTRAAGVGKIDIAIASPPYASQRKYDQDSGFTPIEPEDYVAWYMPISGIIGQFLNSKGSYFLNIKEAIKDGGKQLYVNELVHEHVSRWGWMWREEFIWTHCGTPGKYAYNFKNQWEPVFQFSLQQEITFHPYALSYLSDRVQQGGGKNISRNQGETGDKSAVYGVEYAPGMALPGNILPVGRNTSALGHDAAFPVALPESFIKAYSDEGGVVVDFFCGSGSTLVAAHATGRTGLGIEISPKYCETTLCRLELDLQEIAVKIS